MGLPQELRRSTEGVITTLMDARRPLRSKGLDPTIYRGAILIESKVIDIMKPTLPQAKVNKCLIALVSSKVVTKAQVGVSILSGFLLF